MTATSRDPGQLPLLTREFPSEGASLVRIGDGDIGGKATGLTVIHHAIESAFGSDQPDIDVVIPPLAVLATDAYDAFMQRNDLDRVVESGLSDERLAHAFQQADLPVEILGDLRTITQRVRQPLAVRSSSLLEDALRRPFAGVYETKMTPNNQAEAATRFQRLTEAVKYVYASTHSEAARDYRRATGHDARQEKMAVIIQEVLGSPHGERYYPEISGVARSFNFYPIADARREDGVVQLALGLGKTIVDGDLCYAYSPARPKAPPPFASTRDRLGNTQRTFWAVNTGTPPPYDPIAETEYLVRGSLDDADYDDALRNVASTYLAESDRVVPGVGANGPRIVDFAPLLVLETLPLNRVIRSLLDLSRDVVGRDVEIEFAMAVPREPPHRARLGFLQVRPMVVPEALVEIGDADLAAPGLLLASEHAMGNGTVSGIRDVVYVKPDVFEKRYTRAIATQIAAFNSRLMAEERPYLLIGFGRWGSVDPWLGIPVQWGQIAGAASIVEATRPDLWTEPSQGSHFFHNVSSFGVSYFSISHESRPGIDWDWLDLQPVIAETEYVRHVRPGQPLTVKVDGRTGRGVVRPYAEER